MKEFILKHDFVEYQGYFQKADKPRGAIAVIHGIGEHFGRYDRFASYMAKHGYSVYGVDLPGHGKSPGIRGHIGKREDVHALMDELISHTMQNEPGVPVYLMGHSMGGNIVLSYRLIREKTGLKAFIVSSPWIKLVDIPAAIAYFVSLAGSIFVPTLTMKNGIRAEKLYTPSDAVSSDAIPDKHCHPFITPSTAYGCFSCAKHVLKEAGIKRKPVYLMHGSEDGICDVNGSRAFAAAAGSVCTYREWPGLKHELLNEARWTEIVDEILVWLEVQH